MIAAEIGGVSNAPKITALRIAAVRIRRFRPLACSSVIFSLSLSPFGDTPRIVVFCLFWCFFPFFCVSLSNRYIWLFLAFSGVSRGSARLPSFCPSRRVAFLSRGALSVSGVSVAVCSACPFRCVLRWPRGGVCRCRLPCVWPCLPGFRSRTSVRSAR